MTSFEHDMGEMVREAGATEAKKSLAMNYVRATGRIANGHRGNAEAICDAMIAQMPIILEMYLEPRLGLKDVEKAVAKHLSDCPASKVAARKGDSANVADFNWQRFLFAVGERLTWPGAAVAIALIFREPITALLMRLGG